MGLLSMILSIFEWFGKRHSSQSEDVDRAEFVVNGPNRLIRIPWNRLRKRLEPSEFETVDKYLKGHKRYSRGQRIGVTVACGVWVLLLLVQKATSGGGITDLILIAAIGVIVIAVSATTLQEQRRWAREGKVHAALILAGRCPDCLYTLSHAERTAEGQTDLSLEVRCPECGKLCSPGIRPQPHPHD